MYIEQMYTNCLAEAAYYIESDGEAAIIDPIRETLPYIQKAKERGVKIKYVFETHFHADFVSGHIDLARESGARIVFGPLAETAYDVHHAKDGEILHIGKVQIKVLHTPGHTPESSTYLLIDENGKNHCVFTGDTLFVGDVGRPDLLDGKMSKEDLAGMMYDSLNNKIKPLADDVIVYPAHGPGSACGKNIGKETWSTIGIQKKTNYALGNMSREEFIATLTKGLTPPPSYFFADAMINKNGYDNISDVMHRNNHALDLTAFRKEMDNGALILDTRDPDTFEKGFIPGSINIGLQGTFAVWVGTLIDIKKPLLLITAEGKEEETVLRLARVGYEQVNGFLKGGMPAWSASGNKVETIESVSPAEFCGQLNNKVVIDVRKEGEFETVHVKGAQLVPLSDLESRLKTFDPGKDYLVHCAGGYRSMIASSILKRNGIHNFKNVLGGMAKIKEAGAPVEEAKLTV
ncbi:MAG TPA: MBL fold metallo-hydrolase [Bacteroidia bacterium]|jgi:glyoxylase-like metal-dependent hydrolase (beta-lactamase superfamily II)/rhodanese-related sulfurtransferase|nr:MBL fold metallo-hydrolase [Bacteroidia bacterium]